MARTNTEKLYDVIKKPIITEKSMMATAEGKYTFEVQKDATKIRVNIHTMYYLCVCLLEYKNVYLYKPQ